jgi:hypothetical protein
VNAFRALACGLVAALALIGCGGNSDLSADGAQAPLSEAEFVTQADRICIETASHFDELPDPDGVGGAKPIGLGTFMRKWVAKLRTLEPPRAVTDDWRTALDLLVRAANKLDDAEAGDKNAQSEALWDLEARAAKHIEAMDVPFKACFVE